MPMRALLLIVSMLLCGPLWAQAGRPISPNPAAPTPENPTLAKQQATPPMQVTIVRAAGAACGTSCPEWIAAQGRIDKDTPQRFRRVLAQLGHRKLPILIDSPGGSVDEALAIGRLIRARGLDIAVTRTDLHTCQPGETACQRLVAGGIRLGQPQPAQSKCASSCAFILAGGVNRHVGDGAVVGVHQVTSFQTRIKVLRTYRIETRREWGVPVERVKRLISEKRIGESTRLVDTKQSDYAKIARYFTEMGIGDDVMRSLRATPRTEIHWFTPAELTASALATHRSDGAQLLSGPIASEAAAIPQR